MRDYQEIEAKFYVKDFNSIKQLLESLGAQISQPRCFEINYRYDNSERSLSAESKVLRIRQDTKDWITFKSPGKFDGIQIRDEIEFSISDIHSAHLFLQALGYEIYQSYEKYRTVYLLNKIQIMLDELPFGNFIEIEGNDLPSIKNCAESLGLNWRLNIDSGYLAIYINLCKNLGENCGDLSFKNFVGTPNMLTKLNIFPADLTDYLETTSEI